jgi:hypothetical protein
LLLGAVGAIVIVIAVLRYSAKLQQRLDHVVADVTIEDENGRHGSSARGGLANSSGHSDGSAAVNHKAALPAELQAKVNSAVDKGRDYLYALVKRGGVGEMSNGGALALAGLTLLECGIPPDDPVIQSAAQTIREQNKKSTATYGMSLAILFLDRLGDPHDEDLIQTLALRLVLGQQAGGMWTYQCQMSLNPAEQKKVYDYLRTADYNVDVLAGNGSKLAIDVGTLPQAVQHAPVILSIQQGWPQKKRGALGGGDNSNTQFAMLALWVAKRHGAPVQPSLAFVEQHFRSTQADDGSWSYPGANKGNANWEASMTCSGLLGLAVGRGARAASDDQDPALEIAMRFLASTIEVEPGEPGGHRSGRRGGGHPGRGDGRIIHADAHGDLYYLWSLERVAMLYDLEKINGKDWYRWAAEVLVNAQNKDSGSWQDIYPPEIDTSFALLVLKRVNVAQDLTKNLKKLIRVKELEQPNN